MAEKVYTDSYNIVLVDDDADVLEVLRRCVSYAFPKSKVSSAPTGAAALEIIKQKPLPDIVLTDLKMPDMNGVELRKSIMKINARIPVILHSGYVELLDSLDDVTVGFQSIINKPAKTELICEEIKKVIDRSQQACDGYLLLEADKLCKNDKYLFDVYIRLSTDKFVKIFKKNDLLNENKNSELKEKGIDNFFVLVDDFAKTDAAIYVPVRVSTLKPDKEISFSLFRRDEGSKYLNLMPAGFVVTVQHIQLLKAKTIKQLFILDKEEDKYQQYLERVLESTVEADSEDEEETAEVIGMFASYQMDKNYGKATLEGIRKVKNVGGFLDGFMKVGKNWRIGPLLDHLKGGNIQRHVLQTTVISLGIFNEIIEMRKSPKLEKLVKSFEKVITNDKSSKEIMTLVGLLHDVGKIPLGIENVAILDEMSEQELEHYCKHVEESVKILEKYSFIPKKVIEVIGQHEEYADGSGKPNGLKKSQMSIFAQILSLVNYYVTLRDSGFLVHDALVDIEMNIEKFNQYLIPVLKRVVQPDRYK